MIASFTLQTELTSPVIRSVKPYNGFPVSWPKIVDETDLGARKIDNSL